MTQLTLRSQKYIKGMFDPNVVWNSYFLIRWQSLSEKERNR